MLKTRSLAVGCDASGKSTALNLINERYGDQVIELTKTDEIRRFKIKNLNREIDEKFITKRENLFMRASNSLLKLCVEMDRNIVTCDSHLTTMVSHNAMRSLLCSNKTLTPSSMVDDWLTRESELNARTIVLHTYANNETIRSRIHERQQLGDKTEAFRGFNSLEFLQSYQESWSMVIRELVSRGIACVSVDTDNVPKETMIDEYCSIRDTRADTIEKIVSSSVRHHLSQRFLADSSLDVS